jgi:hypothetical protein
VLVQGDSSREDAEESYNDLEHERHTTLAAVRELKAAEAAAAPRPVTDSRSWMRCPI